MRRDAHTYLVAETGLSFVAGLIWHHSAGTRANPQLLAKRFQQSLYVINSGTKTQIGFGEVSSLPKRCYSAALALVAASAGECTIVACRLPDGKYWLCGADGKEVMHETDLVVELEDDCLSYLQALVREYPAAKVCCPDHWPLASTFKFNAFEANYTRDQLISVVRAPGELVQDLAAQPKLQRAAGVVLALVSVYAAYGTYLDYQAEQEAREQALENQTEEEREKAEREAKKDLYRRQLSTPWIDNQPTPVLAAKCAATLDGIPFVPGWQFTSFSCKADEAIALLVKQPGAYVSELRKALAAGQLDLDDTQKRAALKFSFAKQDFSDGRLQELPLTQLDARAYITDLIEPHGGTVTFAYAEPPSVAPDILSIFKQDKDEAPSPPGSLSFSIKTELQPEQWAVQLNRIPTVSITDLTLANPAKFEWSISGIVYVKG